ncbi:DUF2637 domain-containing protein [Nocardiopsis alborubida]|uniref:DUF2637 domain-containing protein n=1 Tax=Nocardiopsis alborubida TaxID=146802 RepID=A0A7X6M982_9ACTN|nr:DUF2637 domain-containing protein [Nocardiopsis alborubida]NKY96304.1 DUF2637 domain-containing protein [Nocardiopsis alborubida]
MAPYNNAPESGTRNGRPAAGRGAGAGALVGGGLFVGLIALCALVISYNGIFQFAEYGGHEGSLLAHVFPVTYTLLLMMACWVSYLLRGAPPRERLWVDLVLIPVLVLFAATAMLMSSLELVERVHQGVANVIVAVAPLAALLVAFLLWMTLRAHMRRRRRARVARPRPADDPTTVLHARTAVPPRGEAAHLSASEGGALKARLLRLGSDGRDEEETEAFAPVARPGRDDDGGDGGPRPAGDPEAPGRPEAFGEPESSGERGRGPEPDAVWDRDEPGRDEEGWDDAEFAAEPLPVADTDAPRSDAEDGGDGIEASVPTLRLPRRSRDGHNPIKRAAEEAPVVPGAASPARVEPEAEPESAAVVPDHLADEGFEHEPPFGDPVSDEADAPPAAAEPQSKSEPPVGPEPGTGTVTAFDPESEPPEEPAELRRESAPVVAPEAGPEDPEAGPAPEPAPVSALRSAPSEPEPGPVTEPEPVAAYAPVGAPTAEEPREAEPSAAAAEGRTSGHGTEHGAPAAAASDRADDPGTALWEPPEDDSGAHALADYVPPVWTPPEDDTSPFAEEPEPKPEPTPVLDHDTGPTVRAAFRISDLPPEAARPSDGPVEPAPGPEEAQTRHAADEDRSQEGDPLQEPEPLGEPEPSVPDTDLPPEAEELPPTVREEGGDGQAPSSPAPPAAPAPGAGRPAPERRGPLTPVGKRPMVLKPPRPPMPDFAAGPPSRRVRSEPLRPDE